MMFEKLKERLAQEEDDLKRSTGAVPRFSESGPISMGLFKALMYVVEEQEREIEQLKSASKRWGL